MKNIFLIILVAAVSVRIAYYFQFPGMPPRTITWDTLEYYQYGALMLEKGVFVHEWRTPLYSVFLHLPAHLSGNSPFGIYSPNFYQAMNIVVFIQNLISIVSLFFFYKILLRLGWSRVTALLFCVIIALDIFLIFHDRMIMTDSLAASWLVFTVFFTVKILKKQTAASFALLFFLFSIGFLLRPILAFMPFFILPIICLYRFRKNTLIGCGIIAFVYFLFVQFYSGQNYIHNQYYGISRTADINLLGKVFQYNLPLEAGRSFGRLYDNLKAYKKWGDMSNPWEFAKAYPDIYWNQRQGKWDGRAFDEIREFSRTVVRKNIFQYILQSFLIFPTAMTEMPFIKPLVPTSADVISKLFQFLFLLFQKLKYLTLITLICFPLTLIEFIIKRRLVYAAYALIVVVCLYQISMAVFFSNIDFGRLILPAQTFLYLFSFYWYSRIIRLLFPRLKNIRTILKKK